MCDLATSKAYVRVAFLALELRHLCELEVVVRGHVSLGNEGGTGGHWAVDSVVGEPFLEGSMVGVEGGFIEVVDDSVKLNETVAFWWREAALFRDGVLEGGLKAADTPLARAFAARAYQLCSINQLAADDTI